MPSRVSITVPACAPCCGVSGGGGCAPPTVGTVTCASRTGSGNLRGWSKFANFNSGDWNYRKATSASVDASEDPFTVQRFYSDGACSVHLATWTRTWLQKQAIWDVALDAISQHAQFVDDLDGCLPTTLQDRDLADENISPSFVRSETSATLDDYTRQFSSLVSEGSCQFFGALSPPCTGSTRSKLAPHNCTETLSAGPTFDSVSAALARGSSSSDTLCKTTAGIIGSTTAFSIGQISITGTTSVQATIPLTGLVIGESYELDILVNRYTAGGGGLVDQITVTVEFTAEATSENYIYDVPVNTDFDYEYDSIADARCAA